MRCLPFARYPSRCPRRRTCSAGNGTTSPPDTHIAHHMLGERGGIRPRRAMRNARFGRRPFSRVRRVLLLRRLQRPVPPGQGVRGRRPTLLNRGEGMRGRAPTLLNRGGCWFGWPRRPGRPGRTGRDGVGWRQTAEIARPRIGAELPTQLSIDVEVPRGAAGRGGDDLEYCGAVAVVDRCGHCVHVRRHFLGRQ